MIRAEAEAEARVVQAQAEAEALQLIGDVLAENSDLLTYQYINKISPGIRVMLLPHDTPLILPLPTLGPEEPALVTSTPIAAPLPITPTETLTPTIPIGTPAPTPTP